MEDLGLVLYIIIGEARAVTFTFDDIRAEIVAKDHLSRVIHIIRSISDPSVRQITELIVDFSAAMLRDSMASVQVTCELCLDSV